MDWIRSSRFVVGASALLAILAAEQTYALTVVDVSAKGGSALLLRDDGTVWAWGDNSNGALGDGTIVSRASPVRTQGLPVIVAISAGYTHSLALDSSGEVWAWGTNTYGELGDGSSDSSSSRPVRVPGLTNIIAVSAGTSLSLALRRDGTVWCWGHGSNGELGNGHDSQTDFNYRSNVPVQAVGLNNAIAIAAGGGGGLAVTSDGHVVGWGANNQYQLGGALGADQYGNNVFPTLIPNISNVRAVSGGAGFVLALKADGTVWTWGIDFATGEYPTLSFVPVPTQVSNVGGVKRIVAGLYGAFAIGQDGTLVGWGGDSSQFGLGCCSGVVKVPTRLNPPSLGASGAALGFHSGYVLGTDGTIASSGSNDSGALGIGDLLYAQSPLPVAGLSNVVSVAADSSGSIALKSDGTIWEWGGDQGASPQQVPGLSGRYTAISARGIERFALRTDGVVMAFLGLGNGVPTLEPGLANVVSIAASGVGVIAKTASGHAVTACDPAFYSALVFCNEDFGFSDVTQVAAGNEHFLVLRADGTVWAQGINQMGQLGNGTAPYGVAETAALSAPPSKVVGLDQVRSIFAGDYFSGAVRSDGSVYLWGLLPAAVPDGDRDNSFILNAPLVLLPTRVGDLSGVTSVAAMRQLVTIDASGKTSIWGLGTKVGERDRLTPGPIPQLDGLIGIGAGTSHTLGVTSSGAVVAQGQNDQEQLAVARIANTGTWMVIPDAWNQTFTANAVPVVEFLNPSIGLGHYFITGFAAEAVALDTGTPVKGWQRTGRSWRAWLDQGSAPPSANPVYRFFSSRWNSHFYTADPAERDALLAKNPTQNPAIDWALEATAFFAAPSGTTCPSLTVAPSSQYLCPGGAKPTAVDCPAGYYPVFRAYDIGPHSPRQDPNHRFTSNWIDIYRNVRFFGYVYEGVAFCSPASSQSGGDLQAFNTYPGDAVNVGDSLKNDYWYSNAGPGDATGATIVATLPTTVSWTVQCRAYNRAQCPADLDPHDLRTGVTVPALPAGGVLQLTVTGAAPSQPQTLSFTSSIVSPSGAPDPYGLNNASTVSQTVVKAKEQCTVSLMPGALGMAMAGTSAIVTINVPDGCAWSASSDQGWATVAPNNGSGSGSFAVTATSNLATSDRIATVTVVASAQTAQLPVRQPGMPMTTSPAPCTTAKLSRTADQIGANGVNNFVGVQTPTIDCTWVAISQASWIVLTASSSQGSGQVEYAVLPNSDVDRSGTITVTDGKNALQVFTVYQTSVSGISYSDSGGSGDGGGDGSGSGGGDAGG